jgi:hypothetical protein
LVPSCHLQRPSLHGLSTPRRIMRSSHYSASCDRPGRSWAERQTFMRLMGFPGPRTTSVSRHPCCLLKVRQPALPRVVLYVLPSSSRFRLSLDQVDINSGWYQSTFSCSILAHSLVSPHSFLIPPVCFRPTSTRYQAPLYTALRTRCLLFSAYIHSHQPWPTSWRLKAASSCPLPIRDKTWSAHC